MTLLRKFRLLIELMILEKSMSILFHLPIEASTQYLEHLKTNQDIEPKTLNALAVYHQKAIELKKRIKIETNLVDSSHAADLHDEVQHSSC